MQLSNRLEILGGAKYFDMKRTLFGLGHRLSKQNDKVCWKFGGNDHIYSGSEYLQVVPADIANVTVQKARLSNGTIWAAATMKCAKFSKSLRASTRTTIGL